MGFKAALEAAEKNIPDKRTKGKKVDNRKKDEYLEKYREKQDALLGQKSEPPDDEKLLKQYNRGKKDMEVLLRDHSITYCRQMVFMLGFNRKTDESDPKLKAFCDGFCDRLLEGK